MTTEPIEKPPVWRLETTNDAYVKHSNARTETYGYWDRMFGAWVKFEGHAPEPLFPAIAFLKPDGSPYPIEGADYNTINAVPWPGDPDGGHDAFIAYCERIPESTRQLVGLFPRHQLLILQLIREIDWVYNELRKELKSFGPEFVLCAMDLAKVSDIITKAKRQEFADGMFKKQRVAFLRELTGRKLPSSVISTLFKANFGWMPIEPEDFISVMETPEKSEIAVHIKDLNHEGLRALRFMPRWMLSPLIIQAINEERPTFIMKRFPEPPSLDLLADIPLGKVRKFRQKLDASLRKGNLFTNAVRQVVDEILDFPDFDIMADTPRLKWVRNFDQLKRDGREMKNCAKEYFPQLAAGSATLFRWVGNREHAHILLINNQNKVWVMDQMAGEQNSKLRKTTQGLIRNELNSLLGDRFLYALPSNSIQPQTNDPRLYIRDIIDT